MPGAAGAAVSRQVVDGPSADIHAFQRDLAVAPDGSAAATYLKKEGGKDHVFVSVSDDGGRTWSAPQRVDTGLDVQDSVLPDVGAGNSGRVVVTFRNDTRLYSALRPGAGQPFALVPIINTGFTNNKALVVDMNPAGIAYAAYVNVNDEVRAARLQGATWTPVGAAPSDAGGILNNDPAKDVEPDGGGIAVAAGGDGNGVVAWKEDDAANKDQAWLRRLPGTTPGGIFRASIDSLDGHAHSTFAEMMDLDSDAAGDVWFVFREGFDYGGTDIPRLLARRLPVGAPLEGHTVIDALGTNPPSGGEEPRIDVNASGQALAGQQRQLINETWGAAFFGGAWSTFMLDSANRSRSSPALGDSGGGALAFARGNALIARLVVRGALAGEATLSAPDVAAVGTAFGGADAASNVLFAFTEDTSATERRIVVARVDEILPPEVQPADVDPPDILRLVVRPARIAVGRRPPALVSRVRRRATIQVTLSEQASVRLTFQRKRRGGRYVTVRRGRFTFAGKAGRNRVRFEGRMTRRSKLRPGRYRVRAVATDAAGNVSRRKSARFRIVRP